MGSAEGSPRFSVFNGVKIIPSTPEVLMAEINTAIANLEYVRATAHLDSPSSSLLKNTNSDANVTPQFDVKMADEAYKAGCAALAAGKLDEALHSLNLSLSKCPPDKTSAVAKLQSLISLTSQQLHNLCERQPERVFGEIAFIKAVQDQMWQAFEKPLKAAMNTMLKDLLAREKIQLFKELETIGRISCFSNMSVFYHEEPTHHHSKRCKFLATVLKDAFSNCRSFHGRLSTSRPEDENQTNDFDEELEVVVSEIRSRAMEKLRRKPGLMTDSFSWVFSPGIREVYIKALQQKEEDDEADEDAREEFFSIGSCLSCYSSAVSGETFYSVKTNFSRSSSLNGLDYQDFRKLDFQDLRRSIIRELCYCEGWPFGLCRKAVLLPPLPKSPSESWSWHKGTRGRIAKLPYV
ncbi:hypothetical protein WN944_008592 [Citrus x changshan-huyou]|uniref:Uncharacterized protein n=1 Tax=Citrus x changshan-huyou TaxID=2935761 RepID=A0AAP0MQ42_9ROSI